MGWLAWCTRALGGVWELGGVRRIGAALVAGARVAFRGFSESQLGGSGSVGGEGWVGVCIVRRGTTRVSEPTRVTRDAIQPFGRSTRLKALF